MSNPQPAHLKNKPPRAEPWQPDRPGHDVHPAHDAPAAGNPSDPSGPTQASREPGNARAAPTARVTTTTDQLKPGESAASPEAAVPRDAQTGQALNDDSLVSNDESGLSDGRSGSTRLPES